MKNKLICILLLSLTSGLFADVMVINEDLAVDLALENNLSLKKQQINQLNAELDRDVSYNAFYPDIKTNTAISHTNSVKTQYPYIEQINGHMAFEPDPYNLAMGFEASIYLTPAIVDGIKLLNSNADLESIKTVKQEHEIVRDVKKSFYTLLLLKEQISLYQFNHDELEKRYLQLKKNFENGYVDELQVLEVQVALENFKPQLNNLQQLYLISLANFKFSIGLEKDMPVDIEGDIEITNGTYEKEKLLNKAFSSGYDMAILNQNIKLLDQQIKLKKSSGFLPVLGFSYSMSTALNDPFNMDKWDVNNFQDDMGSFSVFLSMDLDAYLPNSKERNELKKLENNKKIALIGKKELKDGLDLQLTEKLQSLNNSLQLQDSLKSTVELAQKRVNLTRIAYNQGSKEILEVESAENELRKAQLELLNEKYNYLISVFDIEYIIGEGL